MLALVILGGMIQKTNLPYGFYYLFLPCEGFSMNWFINYAFQILYTAAGVPLALIYYLITLFLMNQSCWHFDVAISYVESAGSRAKKRASSEEMNEDWRVVIESSCSAMKWRNEVQEVLKFPFMTEFFLVALILCLSLYTISATPSGSVIAYIAALAVFSQLFVYCWMGNRVIMRIEKLSSALYQIDWFEINVQRQKDVQLMLAMSQNMNGFNGIFNEVNVETFQRVRS